MDVGDREGNGRRWYLALGLATATSLTELFFEDLRAQLDCRDDACFGAAPCRLCWRAFWVRGEPDIARFLSWMLGIVQSCLVATEAYFRRTMVFLVLDMLAYPSAHTLTPIGVWKLSMEDVEKWAEARLGLGCRRR